MAPNFTWLKLEDVHFALFFSYITRRSELMPSLPLERTSLGLYGLRFSIRSHKARWLSMHLPLFYGKVDPFCLILHLLQQHLIAKISYLFSEFFICFQVVINACAEVPSCLFSASSATSVHTDTSRAKNLWNVNSLSILHQGSRGIYSISCLRPCLSLHEAQLPIITAIAKLGI